MPFLGVNMAIIRDGRVLLTRREDYEVWCLPGGAVEDGESLGEAVVREAREETGLETCITRLVGLFSMPDGPRGGLHLACFAGEITGGEFNPQPQEVVEMRFFAADEIPPDEECFLDSRRQALDALSGYGGSTVFSTEGGWPFGEDKVRKDLYRMRDESGLPRREFYRRLVLGRSPRGRRET